MSNNTALSEDPAAIAPLVLPGAVAKFMEKQGIAYSLCHSHAGIQAENSQFKDDIPPAQTVHLVVLQDSLGKVQLLIGQEQLLDLSQLCELMGRNLQGISLEDAKALQAQQDADPEAGFASIPLSSIPDYWVDQHLLELDTLYLNSGLPHVFIQVSKDEASKLIQTSNISQFCHNTAELNHRAKSEPGEQQISQAVSQFTTYRIKQRLDQTIEIPPLPDTAERIIKLRVDPNASIHDLSKVVETDPSLAAQVVSWASSPFYGAPGGIASVQDAVIRVLGFDLVINLALGLALGKALRLPMDGPKGVTPYWQQAVYNATMMQNLVQQMDCDNKPSPGLAYLSGLLHNFGYLVLNFVFPPHFSLISRYIEANPHVSHHIIEQHVLGVTREQISAWLMSVWQMPEQVLVALRWQMFPEYDGKHCEYSRLLFLSNQLLNSNGLGSDSNGRIPSELYNTMHLDPAKVAASVQHIISHGDELSEIANILGD